MIIAQIKIIFFLGDLDLKSRSKIIFCPKCLFFEGQNFKTDEKCQEVKPRRISHDPFFAIKLEGVVTAFMLHKSRL
jgi:hypothetical protein